MSQQQAWTGNIKWINVHGTPNEFHAPRFKALSIELAIAWMLIKSEELIDECQVDTFSVERITDE